MYCFGETRSKNRRSKGTCLPPYIRNYLTPSFIPDLETTSSFGEVSLYLQADDRKLHLLPQVTANLRFFISLDISFHGVPNISVKSFVPKIGALPSTKKKGMVGLGLTRETIEDFFNQPSQLLLFFCFSLRLTFPPSHRSYIPNANFKEVSLTFNWSLLLPCSNQIICHINDLEHE